MITGILSLSAEMSGAPCPANFHTRCPTAALALLTATNAVAGVSANASINLDTVGSEATLPNTAGRGFPACQDELRPAVHGKSA